MILREAVTASAIAPLDRARPDERKPQPVLALEISNAAPFASDESAQDSFF
jgi:hypothetical protein